MHGFANPARFSRISAIVLPWVTGMAIISMAIGLYWGLIVSPPDYQQGDTVRIMYIHVPSAWMGLFVYCFMAGGAATYLIWKHPLADLAVRAAAPIGAGFTLICLITGALWGKPMWGAWWVWDARLTSMLVLLFLYIGYMALSTAFDDPVRGSKASSVLAIVGVINVPIIKFSVDWWNTLHQPASVVRFDGPAIDPSILWPLLIMAIGFKAFFVMVVLLRIDGEIAATKLRAMRMIEAGR